MYYIIGVLFVCSEIFLLFIYMSKCIYILCFEVCIIDYGLFNCFGKEGMKNLMIFNLFICLIKFFLECV